MPRPFDGEIYDPYVFDVSMFESVGETPVDELYTVVPARSANGEPGLVRERIQQLRLAGQSTAPLRCSGKVVVQIAGDAVAISGRVQRSTTDPLVDPNWAPQGAVITGNPAGDGVQVMSYVEPAIGWWRFILDEIDDGIIDVVLGGGAD